MRVLITDHAWPDVAVERRALAAVGAEVVEPPGRDAAALRACAATGVAAVMTCFARVPAEVIAATDALRVVARYGVGLDNIDVEEATRRGVVVTNVPDYCRDEVAEHALALILALRRGLPAYASSVRDGGWTLAAAQPVFRLSGCTLGVIGVGRIGAALARRAAALGMEVLGHNVRSSTGADADGVALVPLDELLARSDIVSLHVPLVPATRHLIGERELRLMRRGAHLINTARGGLVDTRALVRALDAGEIAGAGLDVLEEEPPPVEHRLRAMPNVILTPHVGFYSEESLLTLQQQATQSVVDVLRGVVPANVVNPEALEHDRCALAARVEG